MTTDHRPYIQAVAAHLTRSGLPVQSIETGLTDDRRTARIEIERDDDQVTLHWHESHGWEYSDSAYEDDTPEDLFAHVVDPPAIVLSALISESWTARNMVRSQVPDDEESALAAYAETVEPEPDPADPRQIAVTLMNDAARELDPEEIQAALAEHGIEATAGGAHVREILELAETADITIGWREEGR